MKFLQLIWLFCILPLASLLTSPIQTERAIFLFDNGEKNQIASMLKYAEERDGETLAELDFRIVFMGAALDAMSQEPFCHFPEKLIHYKELGIEETIDRNWVRDGKMSPMSLENLQRHLCITKKAWVGVSCSVFGQILEAVRENLEAVAVRDNPNAEGDTDYFRVAREVQEAANKLALPSRESMGKIAGSKPIAIIGHAATEEWRDLAQSLDKNLILQKMGLRADRPILVYAGVYGDFYEGAFQQFLALIQGEVSSEVQVIVAPHPRYKGVVEKRLCSGLKEKVLIVGEFEEEASRQIKTVEALAIADAVATADATSTIVSQANALRKKVIYVNPVSSQVSEALCSKGILQKVGDAGALSKAMKEALASRKNPRMQPDIFQMFGIPEQGAKLLWEEFLREP